MKPTLQETIFAVLLEKGATTTLDLLKEPRVAKFWLVRARLYVELGAMVDAGLVTREQLPSTAARGYYERFRYDLAPMARKAAT